LIDVIMPFTVYLHLEFEITDVEVQVNSVDINIFCAHNHSGLDELDDNVDEDYRCQGSEDQRSLVGLTLLHL
jgi:hypothetical protein